jgi:hypothetical protein
VIEIAHDGAGEDRGAGDAQPLHTAPGDQHLDRAGREAAERGDGVEHERNQEHRFAPDLVGDGAVESLPESKAEEIGG